MNNNSIDDLPLDQPEAFFESPGGESHRSTLLVHGGQAPEDRMGDSHASLGADPENNNSSEKDETEDKQENDSHDGYSYSEEYEERIFSIESYEARESAGHEGFWSFLVDCVEGDLFPWVLGIVMPCLLGLWSQVKKAMQISGDEEDDDALDGAVDVLDIDLMDGGNVANDLSQATNQACAIKG